jgi:hypothetical protein
MSFRHVYALAPDHQSGLCSAVTVFRGYGDEFEDQAGYVYKPTGETELVRGWDSLGPDGEWKVYRREFGEHLLLIPPA